MIFSIVFGLLIFSFGVVSLKDRRAKNECKYLIEVSGYDKYARWYSLDEETNFFVYTDQNGDTVKVHISNITEIKEQ